MYSSINYTSYGPTLKQNHITNKLFKAFSAVFFAHPIVQVVRYLNIQGLRARIPPED